MSRFFSLPDSVNKTVLKIDLYYHLILTGKFNWMMRIILSSPYKNSSLTG